MGAIRARRGIDGYQVAQNRAGSVTVRLIARRPIAPELTGPIRQALTARLGPGMDIAFEQVEALEKNRSGKTPIVA